jgi:hypothetical protein
LAAALAAVVVLLSAAPGARQPASQAGAIFTDEASATGLTVTHDNGARGRFALPEIMGSGTALVDYDNDGDLDVFLVQGAPVVPAAGDRQRSRLFRNDLRVAADGTRTLRFTDVTDAAGLTLAIPGMGVAAGDYDHDGFVDLFVTGFGADALLRNTGRGTFTDVTARSGLADRLWSTGASFVDYDRDGDLDLFVAHYVDFTPATNQQCADPGGRRDYCQPQTYRPVPDRLFRNDGGRFTDVTAAAGLGKAFGNGLGVVAGDYNGDGWLDLYVANDATPNQLWINRRNGTFADEGFRSGAAVSAAGAAEASMGIASGDFDNDGDEDLFVTNITGETYVLYANAGGGLFEDVRARAGVAGPTTAMTGFGTDWFDYDNDGWLDLFAANGAVRIVRSERDDPRPYRLNNQLFHNERGRFVETTPAAGPAFRTPDVGRGAAFGDIDNDGDVDVVVTANGGAAKLLINRTAPGAHWLAVALDGGPLNRLGYGAWASLERGGSPVQWRRVKTDGSYLSAGDPRLHFGLGATAGPVSILVQWSDGRRERWTGLAVDREVRLRRGTGAAAR